MTATTATATAAPPVRRRGAVLAPGYRVISHMSRGEALDVYEVFSEDRLCHFVAKTVRPDRAEVTRVRDRLLREGELIRRLTHPHLVRGIETVEDRNGVPVVVTELVQGLSLEEIVDSRARRLPVADIAHLGRHLCSALHYLHSAGCLHLDVRPANVVARAGTAVLIDLSIAGPPGTVRSGHGSREYLAPEQARGGHVDTFTDVWGLGATLFEAATAFPPFAALTGEEKTTKYLQLARRAPDPSTFGRRLPGPLVALLEQMLSSDPTHRPDILDVHRRLGELLPP